MFHGFLKILSHFLSTVTEYDTEYEYEYDSSLEVTFEFSTEEYRMAEKHLKKMFSILNYQGNANQSNPEILPHTSQNG